LWTRVLRKPLGWSRSRRSPLSAAVPAVVDARFTWNLARQAAETSARYGNLDLPRKKHLAPQDGALYAFVEKVRAVLHATPARIYVAADAHYLRQPRGGITCIRTNVFQ